jgi:hypothetical protein
MWNITWAEAKQSSIELANAVCDVSARKDMVTCMVRVEFHRRAMRGDNSKISRKIT